MTGKIKKPWGTLAKLAERDLDILRREMTRIEEAIRISREREAKFLALVQENRDRLNRPLTDGRLMADIQVIGMFIQNLSNVINGIRSEQQLLLEKKEVAALQFREARRKVKKMESLMDREDRKVQEKQNVKEQKAMDAAGLARFNRVSSK